MSFFDGKKVLVTGAGGTIGSELCRQLLHHYKPERLELVDNSEIALYQIERELKSPFVVPVLLDIAWRDGVHGLPRDIDIVFHAAAYKHVRMCEINGAAAWRTNVYGTGNLLAWAQGSGVDRFIFVSTDKAVRPTCTMGQTKAEAEKLVRAAGYTVVRSGNVSGSSGSVVPLWEEQIAAGKPVTITDGRCQRYFRTAAYVAGALLDAAEDTVGDETFVVDMGAPTRIYDLAVNLGAKAFDFIGLQPGEKLIEELYVGKAEACKRSSLRRDVA